MIDEPAEGEARFPRDAKPWLEAITEATTVFQTYQDKMDSIDKLYADLKVMAAESTEREFQIFWANMEVLKPAIYARPPAPVVTPRFKDRRDLPTQASEVLERALGTVFEFEEIDTPLKLVRDDLAIGARGVLWLRYDDSAGEAVKFDHVDRQDFLTNPARKWTEVEWVARRTWLTRKKGLNRFGDTFLKAEFKRRDDEEEGAAAKTAPVWEIWNRVEGVVAWVSPGMEEVLDIRQPHLDLRGFFPCPRPAYGTLERGKLVPVPDFVYYRDQVEEINEMTARISALAEALRMKGFYAAGAEDVAEAVEAAMKNTDNTALLVPVSNPAAFANGGIKDAIAWLPVREVAQTIVDLIQLRRQLIEDVYEITGLSDIMRGVTDPNETKGAQDLKSQYGSVRVRERQEEMVRIARDATRMAAEIIAENFSVETLVSLSQSDLPTQQSLQQEMQEIDAKVHQAANTPQIVEQARANPGQAQQLLQQVETRKQELANTVTIDAVAEMLRSERVRPFILDIETDSTVQPDENAEKARRTEFLTAIGGFIQSAFPIVQAAPETGEFVAESLRFAASGFRAGRQLDGVIDDLADKIKQASDQPKGPDPTAQMEAQKAQLDMRKVQAEIQKLEAEIEKLNTETRRAMRPDEGVAA